jgi:uncharacterized membrane protein
MKAFFVSMVLLIVAMIIIPVGGMCESNVNHEFYMYSFLGCEILCVLSILRIFVKRKSN